MALLPKPSQFGRLLDTKVSRYGPAYVDRNQLPDKGEEHNIVCNEQEVAVCFLIPRIIRLRACHVSREQEKGGEWIRNGVLLWICAQVWFQ